MQAQTRLIIKFQTHRPQIPIFFHCVFCEYCKTSTLPKLLNKYKEYLPEPANIINLLANCDVLKVQNQFCDVAGCLFSYNEDEIAGSIVGTSPPPC